MVGIFSWDDGWVSNQQEVDTWKRDQVGLELRQITIEGSIKAKRGGNWGNNLKDQPVEVDVTRGLYVHVAATDVVDGPVVHHEGTIRVLQGGLEGTMAL